MNSKNLIIKIAFGVSAVAVLFSVITLVRSIVIGASVVFPVIQVAGSAAIFIICFLMLRMLSSDSDDEEIEPESAEDDGDDPAQPYGEEIDRAQSEIDSLYEKYNLSDFEEK